MKKKLPILACALALALTGCSSMLNREYTSSNPHVEYPVSGKASVLQAENYQGLVNAILYFVTEHEETGLIHLSNYAGNIERDLDAACREVCTEDPLGAYTVDGIDYTYGQVTTYYEASIALSYLHTPEEVAAIVPATGSTAIRQTISAAMAAFSEKCVLRLTYFTGDAQSLELMVRQTWLDTPLAALAWPEVRVDLYPNSGTSRIAEVTLEWPRTGEELSEERTALEQRALALLEGLSTPPEELTTEELLTALRETVVFDPLGGETAYAALVDGRGNDQGVALALRLLCQLADLESVVVEGTLEDTPRTWLIAATAEGYRHLDPAAREPVYATDDVFLEAGYLWDDSRYPACTDYAAAIQTDEDGEEFTGDGEEVQEGDGEEGPGEDGEGAPPEEPEDSGQKAGEG